jgi:hypothetical protein
MAATMYEINGYDPKSGRLVTFYDVPERRAGSCKNIAGVPPSDDGLGSYPLNRDQVHAIASVLETSIENEDLEYFLEAYDAATDHQPGRDGLTNQNGA